MRNLWIELCFWGVILVAAGLYASFAGMGAIIALLFFITGFRILSMGIIVRKQ